LSCWVIIPIRLIRKRASDLRLKKDIKAPAFVYIYNIKGQLVRTLATRINAKGLYEVLWDGKDDSGNSAASGTYFYKISIKDYVLTGKMTMLK
jgi:flagellar hook assembly protein FlgD